VLLLNSFGDAVGQSMTLLRLVRGSCARFRLKKCRSGRSALFRGLEQGGGPKLRVFVEEHLSERRSRPWIIGAGRLAFLTREKRPGWGGYCCQLTDWKMCKCRVFVLRHPCKETPGLLFDQSVGQQYLIGWVIREDRGFCAGLSAATRDGMHKCSEEGCRPFDAVRIARFHDFAQRNRNERFNRDMIILRSRSRRKILA
jgi:hypothetical protein